MSASLIKPWEVDDGRMNESLVVWRPLSALPLRTPQKILIRLKLGDATLPYRWLPYEDQAQRRQFGGRWQAPGPKGYFHNKPLPSGRDAEAWEWCPDPTRKD